LANKETKPRFVADCDSELKKEIKTFCVKEGIDLKDFVISAILEKYEKEKD
jgi:hypothetical protein